jgi:hypothetical protein
MTLCRSESLRALFAVAASAEVLHCCTLIKILYVSMPVPMPMLVVIHTRILSYLNPNPTQMHGPVT